MRPFLRVGRPLLGLLAAACVGLAIVALLRFGLFARAVALAPAPVARPQPGSQAARRPLDNARLRVGDVVYRVSPYTDAVYRCTVVACDEQDAVDRSRRYTRRLEWPNTDFEGGTDREVVTRTTVVYRSRRDALLVVAARIHAEAQRATRRASDLEAEADLEKD